MINLGVIMDPISSINFKKDSSFAILLEAQNRNYKIYYMEISSLYLENGEAKASVQLLSVKKDSICWYSLSCESDISLSDLDVILMRKDPPFDIEFVYATYILEYAERDGTIIINKPKSLRDCNEKIFPSFITKYIPDTLISRNKNKILRFLKKNKDIVVKPLNKMGGNSVFRITNSDNNTNVIIDTITNYGNSFCMAQVYISSILNGDKRIFIINGNPVPFCLARIPAIGEIRSNLAVGGIGEVRPLSKSDWRIANSISPFLKERGLILVGIDIIGEFLTEINITSPTCIREIESSSSISITKILMDSIENLLSKR